MDIIEIRNQQELEEAYKLIKELTPELNKEDFLKSLDHELLKNHKLFGLKSSGKLISVAAVWLLMNGLLQKFLWIYAIVTTERMCSKGFGKKLIDEIEKYAIRENFDEIRVHAHREQAIAFWENKTEFEIFSHVFRWNSQTVSDNSVLFLLFTVLENKHHTPLRIFAASRYLPFLTNFSTFTPFI